MIYFLSLVITNVMVYYPLNYFIYDYTTKKGVTRVTIHELKPGDHIFYITPIKVPIIFKNQQIAENSHHAIFVGEQDIDGVSTPSIVHNTGYRHIVIDPVSKFTNHTLYRIEHADVPNKDAIVNRCMDAFRSKKYPKFAVLSANCEHFANYCVFGKAFSKQTRPFEIAGAAALGVGVTAAALVHHNKQKKLIRGGGSRRTTSKSQSRKMRRKSRRRKTSRKSRQPSRRASIGSRSRRAVKR